MVDLHTKEPLDYGSLLLAHLACADEQLHNKEVKLLNNIISARGATEATSEAVAKIWAQDDDSLPLKEILQSVPAGDQDEVMRQAVAMMYADAHADPHEHEFLQKVAECWGFSKGKIEQMRVQAETAGSDDQTMESTSVSEVGLLALAVDLIFGRSFLDDLVATAPVEKQLQVQQLRREFLLAGPEYLAAIERSAQVAREDFSIAEAALTAVRGELNRLLDALTGVVTGTSGQKGGARTWEKEVFETLGDMQHELSTVVSDQIRLVHEQLCAKQRSLQFFTIAFLGKTKVGKSTLHAVVTGEGWDAIGVGRQRTTRYNRVYEWRNLRIIDTPGIGAPGGKSDEEIAASVVDEADIVCYVVTNDSQQEAEFAFLRTLKEKGKPLIILLNVKENLQDPHRLERFLRKPERVFRLDGRSGLQGHIDRIRRYAREYYANDFFDIVPVQLYAAQLSRKDGDPVRQGNLLAASRLPQFLDLLQESIIRDGTIRRSQTLLGCSTCDLEQIANFLVARIKSCRDLSARLERGRKSSLDRLRKAHKDTTASLRNKLKRVFDRLRDTVPEFSEDHWDSSSGTIQGAWKRHLKKQNINSRLKQAVEGAIGDFQKNVREILEELGSELEATAALHGDGFDITGDHASFSFRSMGKIGGVIIGTVGSVLLTFGLASNPVGWTIVIAGVVISFLADLFKSKEQKIREAARKIGQQLDEQIDSQEKAVIKQQITEFKKQGGALEKGIGEYLARLSGSLSTVADEMERTHEAVIVERDHLNDAYAQRILGWLAGNSKVPDRILAVERTPGRSTRIVLPRPFHHKRSPEEIQRVLQEELVLDTTN